MVYRFLFDRDSFSATQSLVGEPKSEDLIKGFAMTKTDMGKAAYFSFQVMQSDKMKLKLL